MKIGIDFDNTIAGYDRLFAALAGEAGIGASDKRSVRDALRARGPEGEIAWQKLQAVAYGARMAEAELLPGVAAFLDACAAREIPVHVVSHKTRYAAYDPNRVDLRTAAIAWLDAKGLFERGLQPESVHFADTRAQKIGRIVELDLTHFIDDLEEVFIEPAFPASVEAILLDPRHVVGRANDTRPIIRLPHWQRIAEHVLGAH